MDPDDELSDVGDPLVVFSCDGAAICWGGC